MSRPNAPRSDKPVALLLAATAMMAFASTPSAGAEVKSMQFKVEDPTGEWKDASDAKARIKIESRAGLLFIKWADDASE